MFNINEQKSFEIDVNEQLKTLPACEKFTYKHGHKFSIEGSDESFTLSQLMEHVIDSSDQFSPNQLSLAQKIFEKIEKSALSKENKNLPFEKINSLVQRNFNLFKSKTSDSIDPRLYAELALCYRDGIGCDINPIAAEKYQMLAQFYNTFNSKARQGYSFNNEDASNLLKIFDVLNRAETAEFCLNISKHSNKGQKDKIFEIAKLCAEKDGGRTAAYIKNFAIADQALLFEVAKLCARQSGGMTAAYIKNFGIADQDRLFEIAKLCGKQNGSWTAYCLNNFGIADPDRLFEIAKLCAEKAGKVTADIKNFGITDQDRSFEAAKLCAQQNGGRTAFYIKHFGIADQERLFELAKLCAQQDGEGTARYIKNFGIVNKNYLFEIAKLCAQQSGSETAAYIKTFGIADQELLFEVAKLCARQSGGMTAAYIKNFGIADQDRLFEIAKLCAQQNGEGTSHNIKNFGIADQECLFEVAKLCAQQNGRLTVLNIKNFAITDQEHLFEVAKLCAQQDGKATAEHIKRFGITDPGRLFEVAKLCAQQDGKATAGHIKNFGITDREHLFEIGMLCLRYCSSEDSRLRTLNSLESNRIVRKDYNIDDFQIDKTFVYNKSMNCENAEKCLRNYEKVKFIDNPFEAVFSAMNNIEDLHVRYQNFQWLANTMVIFNALKERKSLSDKSIQWLNTSQIMESIAKFSRPTLKYPLSLCAASLAESDNGRIAFDNLNNHQDGQKNLITHLLAATLEAEGVQAPEFFNIIDKSKLFKDKMNRQPLIEMLILLKEAIVLTPTEKQLVFKRILEELPNENAPGPKKEASYLQNIQSVISLFDFTAIDQLKDKSKSLVKIAEDILSEKLSCGEIDDFLSRYNKCFRESRDPSALPIYAAKISSLRDKRASDCLGAYVLSTLDGTFEIVRYKIENNPHLQKLNQYDGDLIQKWKINLAMDLDRLNFDNVKAVNRSLSSKERMVQLVKDKHFDLEKFELNHLKAYLEEVDSMQAGKLTEVLGKERGELQSLKKKLISDYKKIKDKTTVQIDAAHDEELNKVDADLVKINLELLLVKFMELSDKTYNNLQIQYENEENREKRKQIDIQIKSTATQMENQLEKISEIVKKPPFESEEFVYDLEDLKTKIQESSKNIVAAEETLEETDDPIDILLCGTEISGSCQRVDGDPNLNKGLLGYLMDGKNKIMAVKGADGRLKARCLTRLLWDGEKPVMFMERLYPDSITVKHRQALEHLAREKAEALGVPLLYIGKEGKDYGKPLQALGSPSPYEYCDGATGMTSGRYKLQGAKFV